MTEDNGIYLASWSCLQAMARQSSGICFAWEKASRKFIRNRRGWGGLPNRTRRRAEVWTFWPLGHWLSEIMHHHGHNWYHGCHHESGSICIRHWGCRSSRVGACLTGSSNSRGGASFVVPKPLSKKFRRRGFRDCAPFCKLPCTSIKN